MLTLQIRDQLGVAIARAIKLGRLSRHPRLWPAMRAGVVASMEHEPVPFSTPSTVIDVGASRGQFALLVATRFPEARIVSFEPLSAARRQLEAVTDGKVEVRPFAVGSVPGTATLHVSASDDSSSLLRITRRQVETFPGTEEVATEEVPIITLDNELPDFAGPALLKIDVQGFELEVLRGAEAILGRIAEVYVECSFLELYEGQPLADEVIGFMLARGHRLRGIYNISKAAGVLVQGDLLFRRS